MLFCVSSEHKQLIRRLLLPAAIGTICVQQCVQESLALSDGGFVGARGREHWYRH